ncbi:tigger transposable element-derived protein 4 [Aplysia californica]|uniref:Tigger transposable element-derived protein 4 n=1 Tax=Aplysia californica TaxID=6500 RepID=A0ABM0JUV1_APLCA|nr:tigger transposable element-derived protein 4 [Aplysia californica]
MFILSPYIAESGHIFYYCSVPAGLLSLSFSSSGTMTMKRKNLSIEMKIKLLADVDKKLLSKKEIAAKYGIPHNTLSTIVKNREKIESLTSRDLQPERKRQRKCGSADVDRALFVWCKQARSINAPISRTIMQTQAELIAAELGDVDFKASPGWLDRFRRRHGIAYQTMSGEAASVNQTVVSDWQKTVLSALLKDYSPRDIFNAGETGLFFRCLPDKTDTFKGKKCTGGQQAKDRLTVMVAANMDGSEKLPLLVIGKTTKPRCFSNAKSLPVDYRADRKAWMTSGIFEDWLRKLDRKFLIQGRSILMIVDKCPSHPVVYGLAAIRLKFWPANRSSHSQPCDQGIIHSFKRHYREKVVKRFLAYISGGQSASGDSSAFHISVLDALYYMRWAWDRVSRKTVANCFRRAGFLDTGPPNSSREEVNDTDTQRVADDAGESVMGELFDRLRESAVVTITAEEYVCFDTKVETALEMSVSSERVNSISDTKESESEEDDGEIEPGAKVSADEAKDAMKKLMQYAQQHEQGEKLFSILMSAEDAIDELTQRPKKQTSIKQFFTKLK